VSLFAFAHHHCDDPWESAPSWALEMREMGLFIIEQINDQESEMAGTLLAAGSGATPAQLQALSDKVRGVTTGLTAAQSLPPPPPAP